MGYFSGVGAFLNSYLARGGGNLNTNFPKLQMPGGGGGDVEASIWMVHNGEPTRRLEMHYPSRRFNN